MYKELYSFEYVWAKASSTSFGPMWSKMTILYDRHFYSL